MANPQRLWVAELAIAKMRQLAVESYPNETGGMLTGYEAENGEGVVTDIIGPGPNSQHSPYSFVPDSAYQQAELEARYFMSNGRERYLGDWHTHPHGTNRLSGTDKRTLAHIAATESSGTRNPIMGILEGVSGKWELGAVRFLAKRKKLLFTDYRLGILSIVLFQ